MGESWFQRVGPINTKHGTWWMVMAVLARGIRVQDGQVRAEIIVA